MIKIIAFMGEAGCGKDHIVHKLVELHPDLFQEIVSCTTRPMRSYEQEGVNYYYLSREEFLNHVKSGHMLDWTQFNSWYYGALLDKLSTDKINLGVFNPEGVKQLLARSDIDVSVYRLFVSPKERLIRQLNRESDPNVDEIIRRYGTDKTDFNTDKLDFDYIFLPNENSFDLETNINFVLSQLRNTKGKLD